MPKTFSCNVCLQPYETVVESISFEESEHVQMDFMLTPSTMQLDDVEVLALTEKSRKQYVRRFNDLFLGTGRIAKDCTILNPDALQFVVTSESDAFSVFAEEPLRIRNEALGYDVLYHLEAFEFFMGEEDIPEVYFKGTKQYTELPTDNKRQTRKWRARREQVYEGSFRHFLTTLYRNNALKDVYSAGFDVYVFEDEQWQSIKKLDDIVGNESSSYRFLKGDQPLMIESYSGFAKQKVWSDMTFNSPASRFDSTGILLNPYEVTLDGYWSTQRVAVSLPIDY